MKKLVVGLFFCIAIGSIHSQVVTTNPSMVVEGTAISLTFNAAYGSMGLKDYTGDIYAHTGVITDKSSSDSDWKYVVADWSVNLPKVKMVRSGSNTYQLMVSPDIRTFYGVPEGETIKKLAFVFRNSDGSKEGKDTGSKDIFINVYEEGVNVSFSQPVSNYSVLQPGSKLSVNVNAVNSQTIELYLDQNLLASSLTSPLAYDLTVPAEGKHMLRAVATGTSGSAADTVWFVAHTDPVEEIMPVGLKRGATRIDDQSVYLKLFAPQKQFIYVAGDFNDWMPDAVHQMKKDGDYFWLRIDGLQPDTEYGYQYWIDNSVKIPDPYTNKVLDPYNDQYISSEIYPNLKEYPADKTEELVSVFQTNPKVYSWQITNFAPPSPDTLVVYELLIRDFTVNRDIKTVADTLSYLKRLGVNAVELMPFNEFEGNDSWGYNPSLYFAPDKAYGTADDYKRFIDACHQNGIAVIQDMVLNHSFGQSPLVRMYFENGKPAANNPWYNVNHNMQNPDAQWGYDFNHQSIETQALVDSVCAFWMEEYKVERFPFRLYQRIYQYGLWPH
ncbi:MAG: alpha-amylase family glycosyl hydrolase [Breznakibacter sp.]